MIRIILFSFFLLSFVYSETVKEAAYRSGSVLSKVENLNILKAGKTYDVKWTITSYLNVDSRMVIIWPNRKKEDYRGNRIARSKSNYYIGNLFSYDHIYTCKVRVPDNVSNGYAIIGFYTSIHNDNEPIGMFALIPTGVIKIPYGNKGKLFKVKVQQITQDNLSDVSKKMIFPFQRINDWQICQGYNTPDIDHTGKNIYGFDFAIGTNNLGKVGCYGNPNGSVDEVVLSPADGTVAWIGTSNKDIICINFDDNIDNGHGQSIKSVKIGHIYNYLVSKGDHITQGSAIGYIKPTSYAHIHITAHGEQNCNGNSIPFGTAFDNGFDFYSDGSKYQWHGTLIPQKTE